MGASLQWRCVTLLVFASAFFGGTLGPPRAEARDQLAPDQAIVRPYTNGAGPQMLLRVGRNEADKQDILAVVDPTLWRVQFYTLEDWATNDGRPLTARLKVRGDCALPGDFRPWRAHLFPGRVVIQSQPVFDAERLSSGATFATTKIELPRTGALLATVAAGVPTPIDKLPTTACGSIQAFTPTGDSAQAVSGGADTAPFIVRRRLEPASSPAYLRQAIQIPLNRRFLTSVQELEDARSVSSGVRLRHFLLTTRTGDVDGFSTSAVTVERFSESGQLNGTVRIDLSQSRVKSGQRPVAVSSVGEVLILGTNDHANFYLHSCAYLKDRLIEQACGLGPGVGSAPLAGAEGEAEDVAGAAEALARATNSQTWEMARWYVSQSYKVDASGIPDDCRNLVVVCQVGGYKWAPPTELRLATATVTRLGVPYAQNGVQDAPKPKGEYFTFPLKAVTPAIQEDAGRPAELFGDIENAKAMRESPTRIFGIDCSRFVSWLWGRGTKSTSGYRDLANAKQLGRVKGMDRLKMGDAFLINFDGPMADRKRDLVINHIALYRERRVASPYESWRVVLVAESASSCGGACFSVYDESFFHGWALVRNIDATTTNFPDIPNSIEGWNRLFATPAGGPTR